MDALTRGKEEAVSEQRPRYTQQVSRLCQSRSQPDYRIHVVHVRRASVSTAGQPSAHVGRCQDVGQLHQSIRELQTFLNATQVHVTDVAQAQLAEWQWRIAYSEIVGAIAVAGECTRDNVSAVLDQLASCVVQAAEVTCVVEEQDITGVPSVYLDCPSRSDCTVGVHGVVDGCDCSLQTDGRPQLRLSTLLS